MKKHSPLFLQLVEETKKQINEISAPDVLEQIKNNSPLVLIDVREAQEWEKGHIPHAIHLSKGVIERDIEKHIQKIDQMLVVYCSGGFRSVLAASNLQKMGYTKVYSLQRGFSNWIEMNYPIEH